MAYRAASCLLLSIFVSSIEVRAQDQPFPAALRQQIVARFDANADGQLDESERRKAQESFQNQRGRGAVPPQLPRQLLERFDANGDGRLEPAELARAREQMNNANAPGRRSQPQPAERDGEARRGGPEGDAFARGREALLKRFDANNDGELDADERAQMARFLQQQQQQMQQQRGRAGFGPPPAAERASKLDQSALLERFDTDKNGQLDAQERQAALEQIRQRLANTKPADKE